MSKEKIDALEERVRKIEQEREIQKEVERVIKHEKSGIFKSIINLMKVLAALIFLFTAGNETIEHTWIKKLIE